MHPNVTTLYTIAKTWKQPKCPSTDEWRYGNDVYNGILLNHKKNEIMPFASTWMDPQIIILSEVNQRKTNIKWYTYMCNLKKWYKWTYLPNRLTDRKQTYGYQKGKQGGIN